MPIYELDNTLGQTILIDKFFSIHKTSFMDAYLANMKEGPDRMKEVEVGIPKKNHT